LERTLIPASSELLPDPVAVNPSRVEPPAEMVMALPFPEASMIGRPRPFR